jgi:succinyl-diaminopimelate desuccinylase
MATADVSAKVQDSICSSVDQIKDEMISFLQDLVRVPTVNPPGENYIAGAELIGNQLKQFGYETDYIAAEGLK